MGFEIVSLRRFFASFANGLHTATLFESSGGAGYYKDVESESNPNRNRIRFKS